MLSDDYRIITSKVPANFSGSTLINYLVSRFRYKNNKQWLSIISEGRVTVNGLASEPQYLLAATDTLEYLHHNHVEPEINPNFCIIAQNDHYMVINKPGNLPVHPAGKFYHNTLWKLLKNVGIKAHFINRLDRETSGLVLVALNAAMASKLAQQMQHRRVYKEYRVIVEGEFRGCSTVKGFLSKDEKSVIDKKLKFTPADDPEKFGKNGVETEFELLQQKKGLSLLKCLIKTGRTHQIRATLYSLGYPIVGDKIYGVDESCYLKFIKGQLRSEDYKNLRMARQAVHSYTMRLTDPLTLAPLEYTSPIPEDFCEVLQQA